MALTVALATSDRLSEAFQAPVNPTAKTIADYQERVKAYLAAQRRLSSGIPTLPDKATPQQIDARQRELGKLIMAARKGLKQGDVFGADMSALIRQLLAPLFKGPNGAKLRAAIFEEPHPVVPAVNVRYPDEVPLSTMPPDVMKQLPSLDPALEYRFIGRHLILLDVEAHLIIDVVANAIPA
jgi:hypothetical protein